MHTKLSWMILGGSNSYHRLRGEILDVHVGVRVQFFQDRLHVLVDRGLVQEGRQLLERFGDVEAHVRNRIGRQDLDRGQEQPLDDVGTDDVGQGVDAEQTGHSVQIVAVLVHDQNLIDNVRFGPLRAEGLYNLLHV